MDFLIRGLSKSEVDYLKQLSKQEKSKSFNQFMQKVCREKIEKGQFNHASNIYSSHIENMEETSNFMLAQTEKQLAQLEKFEDNMNRYAHHISRWLEYEGEVKADD